MTCISVTHRDYAAQSSVQIILFSDRLEIWNPGELPPPLTPESLRHPHPSIPRNPLIAEPFFLTKLIERAGTGTLDMIQLCSEAKLRTPDFRQDLGQVILTIWRPTKRVPDRKAALSGSLSGSQWTTLPNWKPSWGENSVHHRLMLVLLSGPKSRSEIITGIGHKSRTRAQALADLMAAGLVVPTIPEKIASRLQQYQIKKSTE
jgi:predicted HTH transcriptional regulator